MIRAFSFAVSSNEKVLLREDVNLTQGDVDDRDESVIIIAGTLCFGAWSPGCPFGMTGFWVKVGRMSVSCQLFSFRLVAT